MIFPLSNTIILSASLTHEILWLIIISVLFLKLFFKFLRILSSVSESKEEKQSSNKYISESFMNDLAIEIL